MAETNCPSIVEMGGGNPGGICDVREPGDLNLVERIFHFVELRNEVVFRRCCEKAPPSESTISGAVMCKKNGKK